jgi:hypothetical protein
VVADLVVSQWVLISLAEAEVEKKKSLKAYYDSLQTKH